MNGVGIFQVNCWGTNVPAVVVVYSNPFAPVMKCLKTCWWLYVGFHGPEIIDAGSPLATAPVWGPGMLFWTTAMCKTLVFVTVWV